MTTEIKMNTINGEPFKTYIFKDGVFSIQPTTNNFSVQNGKLVSGSSLIIPFSKTGEFVYFKFLTKVDGSIAISTKVNNMIAIDYLNINGLNIRHNSMLNTVKIIGLESSATIAISCTGSFEIIEIWLEKIGGGANI